MIVHVPWIGLLLASWAGGPATWPDASATRPSERQAITSVITRSKHFLEALAPQMDPVRLRAEHKMKGKKFYVEFLNAWWDLYRVSEPGEQARIHEFLGPIVARTSSPAYHNLSTSSAEEFRQDIISYLSACVLHEQLGFDTIAYREQIKRIVPRTLSPEHLNMRGVDNTMAIVYRLRQLGYDSKMDYRMLWNRPGCVGREHPDLAARDLSRSAGWEVVYDLTHEVFYLTEFGATSMQCASPRDLEYIRQIHASLIPIGMRLNNVDMVSELVMDLNYLRMTDLPEYRAARQYMLEQQNADGSWGDAQHIAEHVRLNFSWNPDYLPKVGQYLHTTEVTLEALLYPQEIKPVSQPSREVVK
jgi:hypothetical protein